MIPEGTPEDDTDTEGGMPDEVEGAMQPAQCPGPADIFRAKTEDLGDTYVRP